MKPNEKALSLYTLYDRPTDYPDVYVLRRYEVCEGMGRPTDEVWLFTSLQSARNWCMERGLTCIPRADVDPPAIVETWL